MRQITSEELAAIAYLLTIPKAEREPWQAQQRATVPLGKALPVIHQVLFS